MIKIPKYYVIYIASCIVAVFCISFLKLAYPIWKTKSIENDALVKAMRCDLKTYDNLIDAWGNKIDYHRIAEEDKITYYVQSYGKDGIPSKDDITMIDVDYNKSAIIGKWVGKKSKDFAIGVKNGIMEKSKFGE